MRNQVLRSWLLGFVFWAGIGIGCLGLLILQYLTGGAWGVLSRRIFEAGSRTVPIIVALFLPLLLGVNWLYQWAHPLKGDKILEHRAGYLNWTSWGIRAFIYLGLFFVIQYLLNGWSKQQDEARAEGEARGILERMSRFCGPTMVFFVLTVSFAAIDWVMTLDQHWYSTMFGLLFVIGWALSALAFTIAILAWFADREPLRDIVGTKIFHDLGKLMLAFVMVWAYFNFSQYLIIWSGNLPEETQWYISRQDGGWGIIGGVLIFFHFAFPFLMLLSRDLKRSSKQLTMIALFILLMRFFDYYYIIGPSPMLGGTGHSIGFHISWMDFVAPVAIGGIWLWAFFDQLMKRPLIPINDPYLENAIAHGKGH